MNVIYKYTFGRKQDGSSPGAELGIPAFGVPAIQRAYTSYRMRNSAQCFLGGVGLG